MVTITGALQRIAHAIEQAFGVQSIDPAQQAVDLLKTLLRKVDALMAITKQQFDELREAFNQETNALAVRIEDAILAAKNNGGLTGPEGDAVFADLTAVRDRLKTLGASSTDPIPDPLNPPANV